MTSRLLIALLAALLLSGTPPASAQTTPEPPPRWFAAINAGARVTSPSVTAGTTYKVNGEDAVVAATYSTKTLPALDVRAGARVWRQMVVGLGASLVAGHGTVDVEAQLPHPFRFSEPRTVEGSVGRISHTDVVVAAEVGWVLSVSRRLSAVVFVGPAIFAATQEVATRVQYDEQYPYDSATFVSVDVDSKHPTAVGFTTGADLVYQLRRSIGVGALVRYSRATATIDPLDDGRTFRLNLGGLQTTLGLRVRF
jgi:hypothetical protein